MSNGKEPLSKRIARLLAEAPYPMTVEEISRRLASSPHSVQTAICRGMTGVIRARSAKPYHPWVYAEQSKGFGDYELFSGQRRHKESRPETQDGEEQSEPFDPSAAQRRDRFPDHRGIKHDRRPLTDSEKARLWSWANRGECDEP